jgi:SulP family sulfate permease
MWFERWYGRDSKASLLGDLSGGVTSAVVALPLALAFGVSSGAGALAGLYGAICVGFFAALFGGTPSQVSGPTGPMAVAFAAVLTELRDSPGLAFTIVTMAGVIQIAFGLLRLGRYINLVPSSVISGFMSGIGLIIILLQLPPLFGHPAAEGVMLRKIAELPDILANPVGPALTLGLITVGLVFSIPKRVGNWCPPSLLALVVGTLLGVFVFRSAPTIGQIPSGWPEIRIPTVNADQLAVMLRYALMIAFLGSIDSLLTSLIADKKTGTEHNSDRELIGQGIGNTVSGILGGLPGAGATMRTMANLRANGRTPVSGALHSVLLLAVVMGLGPLAERIPLAVLAGILLKVGVDIVDWNYLALSFRSPRPGVLIMLVTLVLTVFVDLVTAVGVGFVMASLLFLKRSSDAQIREAKLIQAPTPEAQLNEEEKEILKSSDGRIVLFEVAGPLAFASAKRIAHLLTHSDTKEHLIIDFTAVPFIDSTAAFALDEVIMRMHQNHYNVAICGAKDDVLKKLESLGILRDLKEEWVFQNRLEAMRHARQHHTMERP